MLMTNKTIADWYEVFSDPKDQLSFEKSLESLTDEELLLHTEAATRARELMNRLPDSQIIDFLEGGLEYVNSSFVTGKEPSLIALGTLSGVRSEILARGFGNAGG
jgi:hypothetical protein